MNPLLTKEQLENEVAHLSYKPGWELEIYETPAQGVWLAVHTRQEDAYGGDKVDLCIESQLPPFRTLEQFREYLRWRLEVIEIHECHEWLKRDGKAMYDPHDESAWKPIPDNQRQGIQITMDKVPDTSWVQTEEIKRDYKR